MSDTKDTKLEQDFIAVLMSQITKENGVQFKSNFMTKIESLYGNMLQGRDVKEEILSYFPVRKINFDIEWVEPVWIKTFKEPLVEFPQERQGNQYNELIDRTNV